MASSQTSYQSLKKKESIIDGRDFDRFIFMERVKLEIDNLDTMELVVSRIKQQGLYRLVRLSSLKRRGDVLDITADITAIFRGIEIRINRELLETLFRLPSDGLKMEDLETFGLQEVLTAYLGLFTRDGSDKAVHPSCHKKRFRPPFVYLHDFCGHIIENRTGALEMCTNLSFGMMVAIMFREKVNWCQIVMKRLQEEASKPASQKKYFGLILNTILTKCDVPQGRNANNIGPGKFIGGSKPTTNMG
ncbi:hypothetical protein OROHE_010109 [Orobanche hederae]